MNEASKNDKDLPSSDDENQALLPVKPSWRFKIIGFMLLALTVISFYVSVISSQISALQVNLYQLYLCRYIILLLIVSCFVMCKKQSLKIRIEHLKYLVGIIAIDVIQTPWFYVAATFMPVGNLDAFYNAFFIITASIYDMVKKTISGFRMFCALIVILGIIFLSQPWREENHQHIGIPCEYLDGLNLHKNVTNQINWNSFWFNTTTNQTDSRLLEGSSWLTRHRNLVGYTIVATAAMTATIRTNLGKFLFKEYHVSPVMFWVYLADTVAALTISLVWKTIMHESYFGYTLGTYCMLFTCLYVLSCAFGNYSAYYSVYYVPVSSLAVSYVCTTILLYISQRTFLKQFYPGNANALEVLGIVVAILGMAILPTIAAIVKPKYFDKNDST